MVAALPELHGEVHEARAILRTLLALQEKRRILLVDSAVVLLLHLGQLHLDDRLFLGGHSLLHVFFHPPQQVGLDVPLETSYVFCLLQVITKILKLQKKLLVILRIQASKLKPYMMSLLNRENREAKNQNKKFRPFISRFVLIRVLVRFLAVHVKVRALIRFSEFKVQNSNLT